MIPTSGSRWEAKGCQKVERGYNAEWGGVRRLKVGG
jgi:hypothetical protein